MATTKETKREEYKYTQRAQKLSKVILREKYTDFLEVSLKLIIERESAYEEIIGKYPSFKNELGFNPKVEELQEFVVLELIGCHFELIELKDWKDDDDDGRLKTLIGNFIKQKGGQVDWTEYDRIEEKYANEVTGYGLTHEPAGFFILHILDELQKILKPFNAQLIDVVNGGDCYNVAVVDNDNLLILGEESVGYYGLISTQLTLAKKDAKWKNI